MAQHTEAGAENFIAPECLSGEDSSYNQDTFSLGVVIYYLCTGELPFPRRRELLENQPHDMTLVRDGYSDELKALIDQCLTKDPRERMTAEQLLQANYLNQE